MTRRQNTLEKIVYLRVMSRGLDDCVGINQGRINFLGGRNRALPFERAFEKFFWELHRPRSIGRPSIEFAVDEICAPAEEQSERCGHDQRIAQICPRKL